MVSSNARILLIQAHRFVSSAAFPLGRTVPFCRGMATTDSRSSREAQLPSLRKEQIDTNRTSPTFNQAATAFSSAAFHQKQVFITAGFDVKANPTTQKPPAAAVSLRATELGGAPWGHRSACGIDHSIEEGPFLLVGWLFHFVGNMFIPTGWSCVFEPNFLPEYFTGCSLPPTIVAYPLSPESTLPQLQCRRRQAWPSGRSAAPVARHFRINAQPPLVQRLNLHLVLALGIGWVETTQTKVSRLAIRLALLQIKLNCWIGLSQMLKTEPWFGCHQMLWMVFLPRLLHVDNGQESKQLQVAKPHL